MNNIPFPDPQDANALNDYLDDLAAGKQANPENEVEAAAHEFHHLASRAKVTVPTQPVKSVRGEKTMHTATLATPVSNRTRRQREQKSTRSYGWLSAVIIAGLLFSIVGSAWLNREGGNPNENLAWAPGTAEVVPEGTIELKRESPESSAWIKDFDPADCTQTSGLGEIAIDYEAMPNAEPQEYGIVGLANSADASAASQQYRAMRACTQLSDAWAYWTDARINEHIRVINEQSLAEFAELQAYYAQNYPEQFMVVASDLAINPEIEAEWSAREEVGIVGQPIPLEAKLNPEWAVELNDGRIAFPATNVYSYDDPAIRANGFPLENPASTVVMIFAMEDGSWKYDDSLALCLVNCGNGIGNPLDPAEATWAQSPYDRTCRGQAMLPDVQSFGNHNLVDTEYVNRQYEPIGSANTNDATSAGDTVTAWNNCNALSGDLSQEATSYMTLLGVVNLNMLANGGTDDPFISAPYLRQWETGNGQLVASTTNWNEIVILDEPVRTTLGPSMQWQPMIDGSTPNIASVRRMQQGFNPATSTELADGRITIFAVPTISIEDRGAITYEGNLPFQQIAGVTLQQHGNQWLVDELVVADSGVILHAESEAWWWDESFDATPIATPKP